MILGEKKLTEFNIDNKEHIAIFKDFYVSQRWHNKNGQVQSCPFKLEYPYTSVPAMIKDKIVQKYLKVKNEQVDAS